MNTLPRLLGSLLLPLGFVLISLAPSGVILLLLSAVLAVLALLLHRPIWKGSLSAFLVLAGSALAAGGGMPMAPVGVHIETPLIFEHCTVFVYK